MKLSSSRVASAREVLLSDREVPPDGRAALERSFFRSIALPNGTRKTTSPGRLAPADEVTCELLDGRRGVRVLDVAISSGVTTAELLTRLESRGIEVTGVGVDMCIRSWLFRRLGVDILLDADGNVLQVATPFFARGRPDPVQTSFSSKVLGLVMDMIETSRLRDWVRGARSARAVNLVSRALLERDGFQLVEHDISCSNEAWVGAFDLVRAANILNRDYFAPPQITTMVRNLTAWLGNGGILVLCRTDDELGANHASFFRKEGVGGPLRLVRRTGSGYELESLVGAASEG
jgi:hypothetical protein